jgi:hypothetical protein
MVGGFPDVVYFFDVLFWEFRKYFICELIEWLLIPLSFLLHKINSDSFLPFLFKNGCEQFLILLWGVLPKAEEDKTN